MFGVWKVYGHSHFDGCAFLVCSRSCSCGTVFRFWSSELSYLNCYATVAFKKSCFCRSCDCWRVSRCKERFRDSTWRAISVDTRWSSTPFSPILKLLYCKVVLFWVTEGLRTLSAGRAIRIVMLPSPAAAAIIGEDATDHSQCAWTLRWVHSASLFRWGFSAQTVNIQIWTGGASARLHRILGT